MLIHASTLDLLFELLGLTGSTGPGEPGGSVGGLGALSTSGSGSRGMEGPLETPEKDQSRTIGLFVPNDLHKCNSVNNLYNFTCLSPGCWCWREGLTWVRTLKFTAHLAHSFYHFFVL